MHRCLLPLRIAALLLAVTGGGTAAMAMEDAAGPGTTGPGSAGSLWLAQGKPAGSYDSYVLPDSDRRHLTRADLAGLSPTMLRLARNEIYARHGYIFNDRELQTYFDAQSWYRPLRRQVTLSAVENANVALIQAFERSAR